MELLKTNFTEIIILAFLIVTFLQSGIDKIVDWKGNLEFITEHFKNSPLGSMVPLLLGVITIMELAAGVLMTIGAFQLATTGNETMAFYGLGLAAKTLIFLLIGQRMAKDYAGAMTLAVYFIIAIFGLHIL